MQIDPFTVEFMDDQVISGLYQYNGVGVIK